MRILLIDVPYDCGVFNTRMGAGPTYLLERGLMASLLAGGHEVRKEAVRLPLGFHTEWESLVILQRQVADLVRSALMSGERALVLSGNCGPAALGVLGGLGAQETAIVWLDAHADFNTPETSPSGFLDGMAAAVAVGHCWPAVIATMETLAALPEDHLVQIGVRSLDPGERRRLDNSRVYRATDIDDISAAIDRLGGGVRHMYVHIDLDVIDIGELRANSYSLSGGLGADQVAATVRTAASRLSLSAAALTALDPALDPERAWHVCERLAHVVADCPVI
jgi:arginase